MILKSFKRYFHTIKYLKPIQLYGRVKLRLYKPAIEAHPPPLIRHHRQNFQTPILKSAHLLAINKVVLLNQVQDISSESIWNDKRLDKLWLYNLHYFDFLHSQFQHNQCDWHNQFILRWINENPPAKGNAWESYTLSLRIINWIKWLLLNGNNDKTILHSLSVQIRYLYKRIEIHLLGNHLIANACALIFAGLFFAGKEGDKWLKKGVTLFNKELKLQILADGAHFELSPMYHSIILESLLDCINLFKTYDKEIPSSWVETCGKMFNWLECLCHPDFDIAFFNDAALGVAAPLTDLRDYQDRLALHLSKQPLKSLHYLKESGYCRLVHEKMLLLADIAAVGASYQPGHAHADTLSFELSLQGQRVFVNSGTSTYAESHERARQRGTAAHNTLSVNQTNSSQVWKSFRVGRRATVFDININEMSISASHDGYQTHGIIHRRTFSVSDKKLTILDEVTGNSAHEIQIRFHLHPQIKLKQEAKRFVFYNHANHYLGAFHSSHPPEIQSTTYHPEFNIAIVNKVIVINLHSNLPVQVTSFIEWD